MADPIPVPNEYIMQMPRLLDLGEDKNGRHIYLNTSSISHIIDNGSILQVFMYTTPTDRFGQLQPLMLEGNVRKALLYFVETLDLDSINSESNTVDQQQ